jgi:intraflagellar transport protein 122
LGQGYNGWVWTAVPRPKHMEIAVGTNDGELAVLKLNFATVHGLFRNRYAYRDHMTDVIVQHLITDKKVRIRCRDYIKKIAVYQDRLAVQLPSRVIIYELRDPKDSIKSKQKKSKDGLDPAETNMHYTSKTKINQKFDCNLLMVTSKHIILCQQRRLQLYNFSGVKEREWVLDSVIKYIKILGGPPGKEGVLVGLKSGSVRQIFGKF